MVPLGRQNNCWRIVFLSSQIECKTEDRRSALIYFGVVRSAYAMLDMSQVPRITFNPAFCIMPNNLSLGGYKHIEVYGWFLLHLRHDPFRTDVHCFNSLTLPAEAQEMYLNTKYTSIGCGFIIHTFYF